MEMKQILASRDSTAAAITKLLRELETETGMKIGLVLALNDAASGEILKTKIELIIP